MRKTRYALTNAASATKRVLVEGARMVECSWTSENKNAVVEAAE